MSSDMTPSMASTLSLLADGQFHSGSEIATAIGLSRTAVWKHLQSLSQWGLAVDSVKGKGYRLEGGIELLHGSSIASLLDKSVKDVLDIHLAMAVDSTNDVAMSLVNANGNAKAYVCLAEYQRAGRGRRGRQWVSPFGHNIYMSLVWEFDSGIGQLEGLSLAVGVCVAQVLQSMGLQSVSLKWPNDILLEGKKVGGILLEISGDPTGVCRVIIGLGLNVKMPASVDIDQPWAAIGQQLQAPRNKLVAQLLNQLVPMLQQFPEQGFASYQQQWQRLDAYQGQCVQVISGDKTIEGICQGVFDNGALRLLHNHQETPIYGGEVSLRVKDAS